MVIWCYIKFSVELGNSSVTQWFVISDLQWYRVCGDDAMNVTVENGNHGIDVVLRESAFMALRCCLLILAFVEANTM